MLAQRAREGKPRGGGGISARLLSSSKVAGIALTGLAASWMMAPNDLQERAILRALQTPSGRSLLGPDEEETGRGLGFDSAARVKSAVKLRAAQNLQALAANRALAPAVAGDAAMLDTVVRACARMGAERSSAEFEQLPAWKRQHRQELLQAYSSMWLSLAQQLDYDQLIATGVCPALGSLVAGLKGDPHLQAVSEIIGFLLRAPSASASNSGNNRANDPHGEAERFRKLLETMGTGPLIALARGSAQSDPLRMRLSQCLVELSLVKQEVEFLGEHCLEYVVSLPLGVQSSYSQADDDTSRHLWTNAINCLANMAHASPEVSSHILQATDLEPFLRANVDLPDCARCIANLSRAERNKAVLVARGWPSIVSQTWLSSHVPANAKVAGLVVLNNLSRQSSLCASILEQVSLKRLVDVCEQHYSDRLLGTVICRLTVQIIASLTLDAASLLRLFKIFENQGDNLLLRLKGAIDRLQALQPPSLSEDQSVFSEAAPLMQLLARSLGYLANSSESGVASALASDPTWWGLILSLSGSSDVATLREAARIVANLLSHVDNPGLVRSKHSELGPLLAAWTKSSDTVLASHAIRAQATLFSCNVSAAKYVDGIFLLHPTDQTLAEEAWVDIVFIHGVTGHPLGTWKVGEHGEEEAASMPLQGTSSSSPYSSSTAVDGEEVQAQIWPKDWLSEDFPRSRILSIGYEVQLSKWVGNSLPLREQSKLIAQQLRLGAVGDRPIIFVCHSFGGLIVKELLMYAQSDPDFAPIVDNTLGVAFYATPHRGAELSRLSENPFLDRVVRSTSVVYELHPENERLDVIHKFFCDTLSNRISTISFGESKDTCIAGIGSQRICFQVVPDESANPRFPGDLHQFHSLPHNHRTICKPLDREDDRYCLFAAWIGSLWGPIERKQMEKLERVRRQLEDSGDYSEITG